MPAARSLLLALAAIAAIAGLGALIATLRREAPPPPAPGPSTSLVQAEAEIAELREALEAERFARQVLEEQLALLTAGGPSAAARGAHAEVPAGGTEGEAVETSESEPGAAEGEGAPPAAPAAGLLFDEERLAALGLGPSEIEELRRLWEAHEMEKLELRDGAVRAGYAGTRRHFKEAVQLELAFREDLGEDTYDRVLHATGRPNRARVRDLLTDSPATNAGLEAGDVVWRYDGALVFSPIELQNATALGRSGELVALEVLRDGEQVRIFVPRGPLGALLEKASVSPDAGG